MQPAPVIETSRLVLRPPRADDAAAIFDSYAQDAEVTRYLSWTPHGSIADTEEFLRGVVEPAEGEWGYTWVVTERAGGALCGMIALRPDGHKAEVGYVLARRCRGRGYMTEALRAVLDFAFTLPGVYRVWGVCHVDNGASARVMEKAGMAFEGVLRRYVVLPNVGPEPCDARCYALVR